MKKISHVALLLLLSPAGAEEVKSAPFDSGYVYHFMLGYGAKDLAKRIDESTISTTCSETEVNYLKDAFKAITIKDMQSPCYMHPDKVETRANYKDITKCETVKGKNNCEACFENDAYP